MEEISQIRLQEVLKATVEKITPYRKNWLIETQQSKWIAKKIHESKSVLWLIKIDKELRRRGFTSMPLVKTDGERWIYTSFVEGTTGNYRDFDEVADMMRTLGNFHVASQGLFAPSKKRADFLLYHRLFRRLVNYYHIINNAYNLQGELGELVRAHGKDFYLDGLRAWEKLQRSPLRVFTDQDRKTCNLAHRDLASHNWMIDKTGKSFLIDWDTADYDLQLGDVWQMSSRILTENSWADKWIESIFLKYEAIRPLTSLEKKILTVLSSFPNEFYREVIGLAYKRKGYTEKNVLRYLKKIISSRSQWLNQVKRLGNW